MASVNKLMSEIRDRINDDRKRWLIMKNDHDWSRICASMDAVEDTESAIHAYVNHTETGDVGMRYLMLYGLLQALFVQQDAIKGISKSLGFKLVEDPILKDIRRVRGETIGHPTDIYGKAYCKIVQMSVCKDSFQYYKFEPDKEPSWAEHNVRIPELLARQSERVCLVLEALNSELKKEDMEHKEKYKGTSLAAIFNANRGYYFEKIFEGIGKKGQYHYFEFGKIHLNIIKEMVEKFRKELEERNEFHSSPSIPYEYEKITYPLEEFTKYYSESPENKLNDSDAYIFATFIREKIEILVRIAKEIDEEYESGHITNGSNGGETAAPHGNFEAKLKFSPHSS